MNSKKYKLFSLILLILLSVSCKKKINNSTTEEAPQIKFAFVDRKLIESRMNAIKGLEKDFLKEENKIKNSMIAKRNAIEEKYKKLEKDKSILDKRMIESKHKEIEKEVFEFQQFERETSEMMNFVKMQISFVIQQKIQENSREIGEANKYLIIFDNSSLYYIDNASVDDITLDVLSALNKNFKKIDTEGYFEEARKVIEKIKKSNKKD